MSENDSTEFLKIEGLELPPLKRIGKMLPCGMIQFDDPEMQSKHIEAMNEIINAVLAAPPPTFKMPKICQIYMVDPKTGKEYSLPESLFDGSFDKMDFDKRAQYNHSEPEGGSDEDV